ncbi:MAG: hypothetical protein CL532_01635 [Aestuariivita sp.]|nr:hypothetical protein [Aestuariivita sp.]|tara:strand:- start:2107 stop:2439 length:333 start_codon:yes stop_codon:yes gene_type:complete
MTEVDEKFVKIKTYDDMPELYQNEHKKSYDAAVNMIEQSGLKALRPGGENLFDNMTSEEGIARAVEYAAFIGLQVATVQEEIRLMYNALEHMAKAIDKLNETIGVEGIED